LRRNPKARPVSQRVFAGIRQHVKLMRNRCADCAGIRRDGAEFQAEAFEDAAVGVVP